MSASRTAWFSQLAALAALLGAGGGLYYAAQQQAPAPSPEPIPLWIYIEVERSGAPGVPVAIVRAAVNDTGTVNPASYRVPALVAGTYYLRPVLPAGWSSKPSYRVVTVNETTGDRQGADFRLIPPAVQ